MALGFSTQVAGRFALVLDDLVNRWLQALVAANNGSYTSGQFVSDVIADSAEVGGAWSFTLGLLFPPLNPVVRFDTLTTATTPPLPSAVAIPPIAPGVQSCTNLTNGGSTILNTSVAAVVTASGDQLIVTLSSLPPLVAGTYTGQVQTGAKVKIADIQLNVTKP